MSGREKTATARQSADALHRCPAPVGSVFPSRERYLDASQTQSGIRRVHSVFFSEDTHVDFIKSQAQCSWNPGLCFGTSEKVTKEFMKSVGVFQSLKKGSENNTTTLLLFSGLWSSPFSPFDSLLHVGRPRTMFDCRGILDFVSNVATGGVKFEELEKLDAVRFP